MSEALRSSIKSAYFPFCFILEEQEKPSDDFNVCGIKTVIPVSVYHFVFLYHETALIY